MTLGGFKYATISDGTTTLTFTKLLDNSNYDKKQNVTNDVNGKLKVIEEEAEIELITTQIEHYNTLRNWMTNATAITEIKIYGTNFIINWVESSNIIVKFEIPTEAGKLISLNIKAKLTQELISNVTVANV